MGWSRESLTRKLRPSPSPATTVFSFTQLNSFGENDGSAQMNANPTATPPSLSGIADVNLAFSPTSDQLFTGSYSTPASNGVSPGALGTNNATTNNNNSSVFNPQIAVDYYIIDSGHGFFVETDLLNATFA